MPYATGSAGLAITVRGSSRRIMIMRFVAQTAPTAARSVLEKTQRQLQKHLHRFRRVDTVTPYQGLALIDPFAIPSMERSCTLRCSATRMHRHTWITVAVGRSEPTTYSWACRSRSFRRERNGLTRSYVDQHIRFHRANPGIIVVRCEEGGSL